MSGVPDGMAAWYRRGPFAPFAREQRMLGAASSMVEATQPAGDFSAPASADLVIIRILSPSIRSRCDFGGGLVEETVRADGLHLAAPGVATRIEVHDPHAIQLLAISSAAVDEMTAAFQPSGQALAFGRLHAGAFRSDFLAQAMARLWEEASRKDPPSRMFLDAGLQAVVATLCRLAGEPAPPPLRGGLAPWQARRAIEHLTANLASDVSLAELAALCGLSVFHFARMFKATIGVPPHAYHRRLRGERARDLLLTTDLSVLEIALAVGYESPQGFARMFRDEVGATPNAWRRDRRS